MMDETTINPPMLTKTKELDQIIIVKNGAVMYRQSITINEGDTVLSKTYHRGSLTPGQDLSGVPEKVASICRLVWTDEVVQAFKQSVAAA